MTIKLLIGFVLIVVGAEGFLRGAGGLRDVMKLPPFVIGLLLIGFGTSVPELAIGAGATLARFEAVALGMLLGSFIVNLALLLGICVLIKPITLSNKAIGKDGAAMVIAALYLLAGCVLKPTGWMWPVLGLALFATYMGLTFVEEGRLSGTGIMARKADFVRRGPTHTALNLILLVGGLGAIVFGSGQLIEGGVGYAADMGVPLTVIGIAIIAIFTSIPEAVVSIHSTLKGQGDVAVGNLLGSNIFNLLLILPLCQLLLPSGASFYAGPWSMHAFAALMVGLVAYGFILTNRAIGRLDGAVLLLIYGCYLLATLFQ
ncbi:MAG: hypothetical protein AAF337_03315 [Pseudomonadota bacterium]